MNFDSHVYSSPLMFISSEFFLMWMHPDDILREMFVAPERQFMCVVQLDSQ